MLQVVTLLHLVCLTHRIKQKSELLRVLGGPSIGDLRSRLTRLIDFVEDGQLPPERTAIRDLLSYRLPADAPEQDIKDEWTLIVEGRHPYVSFLFMSSGIGRLTKRNTS